MGFATGVIVWSKRSVFFGFVLIPIHAIYLRAELNASGSRKAVQREKGAQAHRTKITGLVVAAGQALLESLHQL